MIQLNDLKPGQTGKIELYKPYGLTPKDMVDIVIKKTGAQKGSFSGRLDPMACGCLNIYLDDACQSAKLDEKMDKIYRFKMAFGIRSTSADLLGFPQLDNMDETIVYNIEKKVKVFLNTLKSGDYFQKVPVLSSYPVTNKDGLRNALWWWAKQGRTSEIAVPSFSRILYNYKMIGMEYVAVEKLARLAIDRIRLIDNRHDFNQIEIVNSWQLLLNNPEEIATMEIEVEVSSGFYIRQLVEDIGDALGFTTVTIEIERLAYKISL
jgi:tRNA U55 pseudouridine synthase TruB